MIKIPNLDTKLFVSEWLAWDVVCKIKEFIQPDCHVSRMYYNHWTTDISGNFSAYQKKAKNDKTEAKSGSEY